MRISSFLAVTLILLSSLALKACRSTRVSDTKLASSHDAGGHWVQNVQLRATMDELQLLAVETWPQELEPEMSKPGLPQRQIAFAEAQRLAAGLAHAAAEIPLAVAEVKMSEADRRSFLVLVETLREQAHRLGQAAEAGNNRSMERLLNAIDETCMSCHGRFRDFSGPIIGG